MLARAGIKGLALQSNRSLGAAFRPVLGSVGITASRRLHSSPIQRDSSFTNFLADDNPPAVQVSSIASDGIRLQDGLLLPGACIFLEGKVYLWDIPDTTPLTSRIRSDRWKGWKEEQFQLFDVVVPTPEVLVLGTGKTLVQPPEFLRPYLNSLGIQLEVMDTRNACSTYNLLAEEGRRVAAALLPLAPHQWKKPAVSS